MLLLPLPPMSAPPPTSIPIASPVRAFLVCPATLDGLPSHLHGFPKTHKKPENPEAPKARNLHPNTVSRKPRLGGAPFIPARKSLKARLSVHCTSGSGSALSPGGFESQEKQCFSEHPEKLQRYAWAMGMIRQPFAPSKPLFGASLNPGSQALLRPSPWFLLRRGRRGSRRSRSLCRASFGHRRCLRGSEKAE